MLDIKKVDDKASANSSRVLSYEYKLKQREDPINDLERDTFYFGDDGMQNYLEFYPMYKYFKTSVKVSTTYVSSWKSKRLPNEKISSVITSNYNQAPSLAYDNVIE